MKNFKHYLSEGRPSQRHPLEGHEYHKKTDAQLKYLEDSNIQSAIVDTVERLFHKNKISDYGALEAIRQGVKHHFSKPNATVESVIEGILNILDKRKSENYSDLRRFKEALRQGVAHQLKKQGVAEEKQIDEVAAWQRKEGKNPEGGLNQKGVESYRRENPGSKLQTAVTTKPSKLKPGSKAANRRKSFCARMSGMRKKLTSSKTANDPDSRINKSLRKWNC